jgi:hypothetical protein
MCLAPKSASTLIAFHLLSDLMQCQITTFIYLYEPQHPSRPRSWTSGYTSDDSSLCVVEDDDLGHGNEDGPSRDSTTYFKPRENGSRTNWARYIGQGTVR